MVRTADRAVSGSPVNTLLSPEQIADATGMSVRTVYRRVAQKRIPAYRSGRLLRFDLDEVLAAMRAEAAS